MPDVIRYNKAIDLLEQGNGRTSLKLNQSGVQLSPTPLLPGDVGSTRGMERSDGQSSTI